jgi:hypothetical protein
LGGSVWATREAAHALENMDAEGRYIFTAWVYGAGKDEVHVNNFMSDYLKKNDKIITEISWQLTRIAQQACDLLGNGGESYTVFNDLDLDKTEIENGYTTGYEMLHMANWNVGGFRMHGGAKAIKKSKDCCDVKFNYDLEWNDRIDPNSYYPLDKAFSDAASIYFGGSPTDYNIHIRWNGEAAYRQNENKITKNGGWPYSE